MKDIRLFIRKIISENQNIIGPDPSEENVNFSNPRASENLFSGIYMNSEICILKENATGKLFYFYYGDLTVDVLSDYMSVPQEDYGQDEDGYMQTEPILDNVQVNVDVVASYVSDNINQLTKGNTTEDYENGFDLIEINPDTQSTITKTWSEDQELASVLSAI